MLEPISSTLMKHESLYIPLIAEHFFKICLIIIEMLISENSTNTLNIINTQQEKR